MHLYTGVMKAVSAFCCKQCPAPNQGVMAYWAISLDTAIVTGCLEPLECVAQLLQLRIDVHCI